jgi:hypothetical protein
MKEPKLLADIRENRARAEKAAKAEPPQPRGPMMGAVAETLDVPNPPSNYIIAALDECETREQCVELLQHALQHGYDENGQTIKILRGRVAGFKSDKALARKSAKRRAR